MSNGDINAGLQQQLEQQASVVHHADCAGYENAFSEAYGICKSWCWGHMKCEPLPKDNSHYMVCGECFHVFVTADELLRLHNEEGEKAYERFRNDPLFGSDEEWKPATNVDDIYFCPVCVHDF